MVISDDLGGLAVVREIKWRIGTAVTKTANHGCGNTGTIGQA